MQRAVDREGHVVALATASAATAAALAVVAVCTFDIFAWQHVSIIGDIGTQRLAVMTLEVQLGLARCQGRYGQAARALQQGE